MSSSDGAPSISIVVPTLNEARNLSHVFARLPADAEIIVVDGRSTDDTIEVARSLRPDAVIVHQTRRGKGNALACGFAAATGDVIVMLDADGSADPGEIEAFVAALTAGADYAKGSRFRAGGGSSDITRFRRVGNAALNGLVNTLIGSDFSDLCYGYNAFWRHCLPFLALDPGEHGTVGQWGDGFEVETLINMRVSRAGLRVAEVPSFEHRRMFGVSNLNAFSDGLRVLRTIVVESRQRHASDDQGKRLRRRSSRRPATVTTVGAGGTVSAMATVGPLGAAGADGAAAGTTGTAGPRVCIVGSGWEFVSGISYYTHQLTQTFDRTENLRTSTVLMRRLLPARFYPGRARVGDASIVNQQYPDTVPVFDGVDWFWGPTMARALAFLRRERPDVVVLQWWTGTVLHSYLAIAALARARGAKVVVEFHETQDTGEATRPGVAAYVDRVLPALLRRADAMVVHSEHDAAAVRERFGSLGRPIAVIPHGPYGQHAGSAGVPAPRRHDGVTNLLFFGTIRPYKGLEDLLSAFDLLTDDEVARFRLTVVGETWEGHTLPARMIERSRHRDRIVFVNRYVSDVEVNSHFANADAVVLPYRRSSASGPLHVTMAAGLPVVVTDVGGLTEIAGQYPGATLVPPADVPALLAALRELPARCGRHYPDPTSWAETARRYQDLFDGLLGATGRAEPVGDTRPADLADTAA
ncbi:Glycosyl transferase group 1 (Modular protein) [Frankia sp. AgKG'84/4]